MAPMGGVKSEAGLASRKAASQHRQQFISDRRIIIAIGDWKFLFSFAYRDIHY